jgi:hypothetical protein
MDTFSIKTVKIGYFKGLAIYLLNLLEMLLHIAQVTKIPYSITPGKVAPILCTSQEKRSPISGTVII